MVKWMSWKPWPRAAFLHWYVTGSAPARMLVTDRTMTLVPSQALINARSLRTANVFPAETVITAPPGCPEAVTPPKLLWKPNCGGTLPAAAPLTAKMAVTRVEPAALVKLRLTFVIALAVLVTLITESNKYVVGR